MVAMKGLLHIRIPVVSLSLPLRQLKPVSCSCSLPIQSSLPSRPWKTTRQTHAQICTLYVPVSPPCPKLVAKVLFHAYREISQVVMAHIAWVSQARVQCCLDNEWYFVCMWNKSTIVQTLSATWQCCKHYTEPLWRSCQFAAGGSSR